MEWYVSLIAKRNCFHDLSQGENSSIALDFTITWSYFMCPVLQWLPHFMMQRRRNIVLHPVSLVIGTEAKIYVFYPPNKLSSRFFFWNRRECIRLPVWATGSKVGFRTIKCHSTAAQLLVQSHRPAILCTHALFQKKNREDNLSGG